MYLVALVGLRVGVGGDVVTSGIERRKVHRALEEHRKETLMRQTGELDGWEWHQLRKRHYTGVRGVECVRGFDCVSGCDCERE